MNLWRFLAALGLLIAASDVVINYDPAKMFLWVMAIGLFALAGFLYKRTN